jgi:hypothetical protein
MSIEQIRSHFGFTKMPFGKDLAPSMLRRSRSGSVTSRSNQLAPTCTPI